MRPGLIILLVIIFLGSPGANQPALAVSSDVKQDIAISTIGLVGLVATTYFVYKNSPAERAKGQPENLGPGEWYVGGYTGLSYLPPADWQFTKGWASGIEGRTASNINYQPGIQGGIKFGRYFDTLPWLGMEAEIGFSRNNIRGNQGRISPPLPTVSGPGVGSVGGVSHLFTGSDWFEIWAMQTNLVARYGFLKDKEVPFGRLQPYVGIGPGFEIVYATIDSAKNFAIEAQTGIRYMLTEKVALFFEYKFSYQFQVEYQNFTIAKQSPESQGQTSTIQTLAFDVPHHRFVLGVSYHFKNLFGN